MAIICPTVLAQTSEEYAAQLARTQPFGVRLQLDITDGVFAPVKTVGIDGLRWPKGVQADIHMMYKSPVTHIKKLVRLKPHMVIVHAEASGNFVNFARVLHKFGIKVGVALLPQTQVNTVEPALDHIDHILIFSGDLGHFGGTANLALLQKARAAKLLKPSVEIGWDGGVNEDNAHFLAEGGVDVLNVGGFIQKASDPAVAYAKLKQSIR